MRHLWRLSSLGLFFLAVTTLTAAPIIREPGAIYLSDFAQKPLQLKVLGPSAACYFDIGLTRYAGILRFPQAVQVEAFSDQACRVRGNAQQGGVAAWVPYNQLESLPDGFLASLKKAEERRKIVDALIKKNEVAIGMTTDEVGRSLGKPQKTTQRADKDGNQMTWEFIKYELVPQTTYAPGTTQTVIPNSTRPNQIGGVVTQTGYYPATIYVKVPSGTLKVSFKDGIVDSLDQSEGTLAGGQVSIVTPPLNIYW